MKIVIIGGGAGGLELACKLGRRYRKREDVSVTLVDQSPAHLWKPLLHEVAAGTLNSNEDEMSYLAQGHWHHFTFMLGPLVQLDRGARRIKIGAMTDPDGQAYLPERHLDYDLLVLAIGSVSNDFGIPGVDAHCFFLDSREQAERFNQHLLRTFHMAQAQSQQRAGQLHIAIVGAGATGVELAAELHFAVRRLVSYGLDQIDADRDVTMHLIEGSSRILPGLPQRVSDSTQQALKTMAIQVHLNEQVERVDEAAFYTRSGAVIPAAIKVWAAGIQGPALLADLDGLSHTPNNQLLVTASLQSVDDSHIYAFGDCASLTLADGTRLPPRAQVAHQQADHLKTTIAALLEGKAPREFVYRDFGSLINMSAHSAIGNLMGNLFGRQQGSFPLEGRLARWAYLSLYKMHQIAVHGVVRTSLNTLADFLTRSSKPRLKLH